jgi:hypothetical protein
LTSHELHGLRWSEMDYFGRKSDQLMSLKGSINI